MSLKSIAQKTLDNTLLQYGVLSHHLRRIKTDVIKGLDVKVNDNEYVVYRIVSSNDGLYGDGKAHGCRRYIDINYYYNYDKDDERYNNVVARVKDVIKAFVADKHFRLKNAERGTSGRGGFQVRNRVRDTERHGRNGAIVGYSNKVQKRAICW